MTSNYSLLYMSMLCFAKCVLFRFFGWTVDNFLDALRVFRGFLRYEKGAERFFPKVLLGGSKKRVVGSTKKGSRVKKRKQGQKKLQKRNAPFFLTLRYPRVKKEGFRIKKRVRSKKMF